MAKPLLLDLFCGAGVASAGYYRVGFNVVGVDISPQRNYPFLFIQGDALQVPISVLGVFDLVHASPPCQSYSDLAHRNGNADAWPRLIEPVRDLMLRANVPYVIENVEGAPLHKPAVLCGTMFKNLRVLRHRLFETSFPVKAPEHHKHPLVHTFDKRKSHYGKTDEWRDYVQVTGGGNCTIAAAHDAMGIDWAKLTKREINEAIPPEYTEFVGSQFLSGVSMASAKDNIRAFLSTHVGEIVTKNQIQDAVGRNITEWARRLRELRNEEGWDIRSHHDDSSLKPGEYKLASVPPKKPVPYQFGPISKGLRAHVLERNGYTCQMCGAGAGDPDDTNPGRTIRLHIGHIVDRQHGGSDDVSNLRALCSACNQGAQDRAPAPPSLTRLFSHLRRANIEDQEEVLKWLRRKFNSTT